MIKYDFDNSEQILHLDFIGEIKEDDIVNLYQKMYDDESLPDDLLIFQDENDAEFIDSRKLITVAMQLIKKLLTKHKTVKVAVWQNEPVKTAYSYFYKSRIVNVNYSLNIFSTREACFEWLKGTERYNISG